MRQTKLLMGMPITIEIVDDTVSEKDIKSIFTFFQEIDNRFSTYKKNSEISKFNRGEISEKKLSKDMKKIFALSEKTKKETNGFFNIQKSDRTVDPSGLVKGWAIWKASVLVGKKGFQNFYINAGGDVQVVGLNKEKNPWKIGIKNPFNENEVIKVVGLINKGIATSGTYIRGQHVYDPHNPNSILQEIVSMTVIGKNVYEADRFATAALAMQRNGIYFLERQKGLEGYMIDKKGIATYTLGFEKYVSSS
ncbi:MAG TPA: FAD:protein FMN transferase [Patescibacteria group bacterium]|nr:FAD:protein FMN transferase [Patescibacteria group bacterium]